MCWWWLSQFASDWVKVRCSSSPHAKIISFTSIWITFLRTPDKNSAILGKVGRRGFFFSKEEPNPEEPSSPSHCRNTFSVVSSSSWKNSNWPIRCRCLFNLNCKKACDQPYGGSALLRLGWNLDDLSTFSPASGLGFSPLFILASTILRNPQWEGILQCRKRVQAKSVKGQIRAKRATSHCPVTWMPWCPYEKDFILATNLREDF